MRSLLLIGLAVLAACDDKVVLELTGPFPDAESVQVMLLEPRVIATQQHTGVEAPPDELVAYLALRSDDTVALDGESVDQLRLEIQDDGDAFIPLVMVTSSTGVVAMGIFRPDLVFDLGESDRVLEGARQLSDVTIYQIDLEPAASGDARNLQPGETGPTVCETSLANTGLAWRLQDGNQLRVVLPQQGEAAIDARDLDCDDHAAGEPDCDDLTKTAHVDAKEQCTPIDDDCDPTTVVSLGGDRCSSCPQLCVCDEAGPELEEICANVTGSCQLPARRVGGDLQLCDTEFEVPFCFDRCVVTLVSAPDGWEADLDGVGIGKPVTVTDGNALLRIRSRNSYPNEGPPRLLTFHIRSDRDVSAYSTAITLAPLPGECSPNPSVLCQPL